jgi:hypothetical protein
LRRADSTEALKGKVDSKIKKTYQKANISQIYSDLENAAGCRSKDNAYWSKQAVNDYLTMVDKVEFDDKGNVTFPAAEFEAMRSHCFSADSLGGTYSKVTEVAKWGCSALASLAIRKTDANYCSRWYYARDGMKKVPKDDVFSDRIVDLTLSFYVLTNKTGCEARVNELMGIKAQAQQMPQN